jgi:hypothetical protein
LPDVRSSDASLIRLTKKAVGLLNSCGSKRNASIPASAAAEPHAVLAGEPGSTGSALRSIETRESTFSSVLWLTTHA